MKSVSLRTMKTVTSHDRDSHPGHHDVTSLSLLQSSLDAAPLISHPPPYLGRISRWLAHDLETELKLRSEEGRSAMCNTVGLGLVLCTPGRVLFTPGKVMCTPERVLCTPGRVLCTPGKVLCTPERVLCTPGRVLCTPGRVLCTPGRVLFTPGRVLCTPGSQQTKGAT
ncbi:hypothetical protein Btru_036602 [Bulinus truncatus]|nr:hypothetical protein Btru_036602 [Bulinus truncatus]